MTFPLEGIKVLDLSRVLAGPYCTMLLADMGADVVKVERPGSGDDTRRYGPPFINGESAYYLSVNRNKRSLTVNLKNPEGVALIRQLLQQADVLVENFRPGKMSDFGLDYESVRSLNPALIYCSVSGYGHSGPDSSLAGYDLIIQGEGGITSLTGDQHGPPYKVGTSQADIVAGMNAFQGILLGLLARQKTGRGQKVDIALLDGQVSLLTYQAGIYFATGESPTRMGNQHPTIVPYETYLCQDGYLNLACGNDRIWNIFCQAAGLTDLAEDERFSTNSLRVEHRQALAEIMAQEMKKRTTAEWIELLRDRGVPCGRIKSVEEVFLDRQVLARDMVVELEHPAAGKIQVTGVPVKLSDTPGGVRTPPPLLGADTEEVLMDWISLGPEEISRLQRAEVL